VLFFQSVSPDDAWLIARVAAAPGIDSSQENLAFPTAGGKPPVLVCSVCEVDWTPDAKSLVIRLGDRDASQGARTFVVALQPGETLPRFPAHGIRTQADLAGLRISQTLNGFAYPGDTAPQAAFVRSTTERNIYRVPLPRATPASR
jgi:hypothetical protein